MKRLIVLSVFVLVYSPWHANAENGWSRNPFLFAKAPVNKPAIESQDGIVRLTTIFIHGNTKVAVINGREYLPGDTLGKSVITGITLNNVTVENNGNKKIYTLK